MKKLIGFTLYAAFGVFLFSSAPRSEAKAANEMSPVPEPVQVIYSHKCCDNDAVVRCLLVNWTPVGNACFCPGQGYGYAC